jgi:hypothetical protein
MFVGELNQPGTDLQSGNTTSAQQDLVLASTALNATYSAGASSSGTISMTSSATRATQAETTELVHAIVQGVEAGENSVISSARSEPASISPSSAGSRAFEQESESFSSSSRSRFNSSSISQLLHSLNTSSSTSGLSLLA